MKQEIKVGDHVHVGHMVKGGAGARGVVTKIGDDGSIIFKSHEDKRQFRGRIQNATLEKEVAARNESSEIQEAEGRIPVDHLIRSVKRVLGQSGADRFATHLKAGDATHTTWSNANNALTKQGVKPKHIADISVHVKPSRFNEEVELDEAVEVSHDRYMRSHGKKASGGNGNWMFTHKRAGDVDYNNKTEVHSARGTYSDAKKSAQKWAKEHGHRTVYVMESTEQQGMLTFKELVEALKGKQHKLDKNKNGKLDAHDFKLLRKEETELEEGFINGREYASQGVMHPDHAKFHKVGSAMDFYAHGTGDKISGKVTKNDGKEVHIQADKSSGGKTHKFKVTPNLPKPVEEDWDAMKRAVAARAAAGEVKDKSKFNTKEYSTGTVYTRKRETFSDEDDAASDKKAEKQQQAASGEAPVKRGRGRPKGSYGSYKARSAETKATAAAKSAASKAANRAKLKEAFDDESIDELFDGFQTEQDYLDFEDLLQCEEFDSIDEVCMSKMKSRIKKSVSVKEHTEHEVDMMILEALGKDASAGKWISDFIKSDDPRFAGKSKAKRKEMALAAYYAKQRGE
jgi:hypothetical protein